MLNVTLSDMQKKSVLSLALATVYRPPGPYTDFLKEFADFLSDILVNVDKALIVGDFNIHVDNTNDALGLAFTDLINSFGVKQNVTGPTHRFNHTIDLIISHGIYLTDIDIVPQSDDVIDHFLVSCMLHINDFHYMAPRYHPGRTIVPVTKNRFTKNLPDLSQLLCVPITTDDLDTITSNMGTIFSNMLETVSPIKLKKVREKRATGTTVIPILSRKKLVILSANGEKRTWKSLELRGKIVCPAIDRLLKLPGLSISANS